MSQTTPHSPRETASAATLTSGQKELISQMQALGFSDYEAKAYLALLQCSPATAYELAKIAALPRANMYTVVNNLVKKKAILPVSDKPRRYVPASPAEVFNDISSSITSLCTKVITELDLLKIKNNDEEYVWVHTGEESVGKKFIDIINDADTYIWIKGSTSQIEPYRKLLQKKSSQGVNVFVIAFVDTVALPDYGQKSRIFLHEGSGVGIGKGESYITLAVDGTKAAICSLDGEKQLSYSENKSFVYMIGVLLKHEIYLSEIIRKYKDEIEDSFGPALHLLREKYISVPIPERTIQYIEERSKVLAQKK